MSPPRVMSARWGGLGPWRPPPHPDAFLLLLLSGATPVNATLLDDRGAPVARTLAFELVNGFFHAALDVRLDVLVRPSRVRVWLEGGETVEAPLEGPWATA